MRLRTPHARWPGLGVGFIVGVVWGAGALASSGQATARDQAADDIRLPPIRISALNAVPACVTPARLMQYVRQRNPSLLPRFDGIAETYRVVGAAYGVRWDLAFFQMMLETGSLSFRSNRGTPLYLRPEQNNFGGLGAVDQSQPGETFPDITAGVQAHIEHTLIYAGRRIANPVAERTRNVQAWRVLDAWLAEFDRPVTFRDLALRWNPFSTSYAQELTRLARVYFETYCASLGAGWRGNDTVTASSAPERSTAGRISSAWVGRDDDAATSNAGQTTPVPTRPAEPRVASLGGPETLPVLVPPKPRLAARTPARRLPPPPKPRPPTANERTAALAPLRSPVATAPARPAPVPPASESRRTTAPASEPKEKPKPQPRVTRDDRVRNLVGGRLVHLKADMGAVIPVKFNNNGRMRGEAGNLAFFLGAARDRGRWWVDKGLLCKKWNVWLRGRTMCLTLNKRGKTVHWRSRDGRSGTATIVR